jgi:pimeloyl-ACP methyl ester carboxylesterase
MLGAMTVPPQRAAFLSGLALAWGIACFCPGGAAAATAAPAATPARGTPVNAAPEPPITPLRWAPCPEPAQRSFACATAVVPLDHARPGGATLRLAVIRRPAGDPTRRLGSLFFHPGGPGVAGTDALPRWIGLFPPAVRDRFDLVSWDPRGVGASGAVDCHASERERQAFRASLPAGFPVTDGEIHRWGKGVVRFARRCGERHGAVLRHLSTADSARDLDLLRRALGDPLLTYRGIGHGTLLGAVYANLFPTRVRAMVLDGAIDPLAWSNGGNPISSLSTSGRLQRDEASARILQAFLRRCGEAGTARCPFAATGAGGGAAATEAKFRALLQRLATRPIPIQGRPMGQAAVLATLADQLPVVEAGSGGFPGWVESARFLETLHRGGSGGTPPARGVALNGAALAVQCAESPNPLTLAHFRRLARLAYDRSGAIGPLWSWADSPCAAWPARAAAPYSGPWSRRTLGTVLVIGTRFDPATPFQASLELARELGNARLLSVNGYGHTAMLNPSACSARHEAAYLIAGTLPPEGSVCRPDRPPFTAVP